MTGCHQQMGDVWMPDRATTLEEVLHAYMLLEEDWTKYNDDKVMQLQMALTAMIFIGGFSGALREEELPKLELGAIRNHWQEAVHHVNTLHVPLVLFSGQFKLMDGEKLFFLPLACRSSAGIEIRMWTQRVIEAYEVLGVVSGPVFWVSHKGDLDMLFHGILSRVQERWPQVLVAGVKIQDKTSVRHSLRQGSTTAASN
jgi:hypothetical protein